MTAELSRIGSILGTRGGLLLILVVALLVRLPGLDRDLWYDEASSLFNARGTDALTTKIVPNGPEMTGEVFARDGGWRESLLAISHAEWMPPLYFLLLRGWIMLFGEGNLNLRLLSLLIGLATILGMFFLGRTVFDEKVGLAAAALLSLVPLHLQYSQEVRPYPLAILFVVLASWAYWNAYRATACRSHEWRHWLLYTALAAPSLYTHYFTAWIFMAHAAFAVIQPRQLRRALVKRLVGVALVLVVAMSPWLLSPYFENQLNLLKVQPYGPTFWATETAGRVLALILYFFAGTLPDMHFRSAFGLILLSFCGVGLFLPVSLARNKENRLPVLFSFLLFVTPILLMAVTAAILDKAGLVGHPKFILPALAGLCLLFAIAIILSPQRALSFLIALLVLSFSVHFQVKWHNLEQRPSPPWWSHGNVSAAVTAVNQRMKPGELILFDDGSLAAVWNAYQRGRMPQLVMDNRAFYFNQPMDFDSRWRQVERTYDGIYLVRRIDMPVTETLRRLERTCHLVKSERIHWLEIRHYRNPTRRTFDARKER